MKTKKQLIYFTALVVLGLSIACSNQAELNDVLSSQDNSNNSIEYFPQNILITKNI